MLFQVWTWNLWESCASPQRSLAAMCMHLSCASNSMALDSGVQETECCNGALSWECHMWHFTPLAVPGSPGEMPISHKPAAPTLVALGSCGEGNPAGHACWCILWGHSSFSSVSVLIPQQNLGLVCICLQCYLCGICIWRVSFLLLGFSVVPTGSFR